MIVGCLRKRVMSFVEAMPCVKMNLILWLTNVRVNIHLNKSNLGGYVYELFSFLLLIWNAYSAPNFATQNPVLHVPLNAERK